MSLDRVRITQFGNVKSNDAFASFEHLKRRRDGGHFTRDNIVLAHGGCNRKRDVRKFTHDIWSISSCTGGAPA